MANLTVLHANPRLAVFAGCGSLTSKPVPAIKQGIALFVAAGGNGHFLDLGQAPPDGCFGHPGAAGHAHGRARSARHCASARG